MSTFRHVAPLGTADAHHVLGRAEKKPWEYALTAAIPHIGAIEPLRMAIRLLRLQTARPYIFIIDTGSSPADCMKLEAMRADDLEVHYVRGHAYRHSSEPVCVALDLAQALCRTKHLFHTHSDVFLRRRDFLGNMVRICNANTPAVGYRMSPRDWPMDDGRVTEDWKWMVGHTALTLYMPSIHRAGATWSYQRTNCQFGYPWQAGAGWPDTENGFNHCLREAGITPVFIGHDQNFKRMTDENIDHIRSHSGTMIYAKDRHEEAARNMALAIVEAEFRAREWEAEKVRDCNLAKAMPSTTQLQPP